LTHFSPRPIIPAFPEHIKEQVRKQFFVRNVEEASVIADGLTWIALLIMQDCRNNVAQEKKMWLTFGTIVREGGWSYLKGMAAQYRQACKSIPYQ
jgi:hypothetical protein